MYYDLESLLKMFRTTRKITGLRYKDWNLMVLFRKFLKNNHRESLQLYKKISRLPADLKKEVNDFVDFLLNKKKSQIRKKQPKFVAAKGQIYTSSDFDEPLDEMKNYLH